MGKVKKVLTWPIGTDQGVSKPPKPPQIPSPEDLEARAAEAAAEELRRRRKGGRGSTILTGGLNTAPVQKKTLLGQ
jgi:hypothetical protein